MVSLFLTALKCIFAVVGNDGEPGVPEGEPEASEGEPEAPRSVGGVTYHRWGNSTCRSGASLVYDGKTGSTFYWHKGGASNYICMPHDPHYTLPYRAGNQRFSYVYGTEYEVPPPGYNTRYHNAPCAVCYVATKHTTVMIPAHTSCPTDWTREYYGYLASESIYNYRTMYVCVDLAMESVPGSSARLNGGYFYTVEAHCSGVSCPPYNSEKELGCVVCSK